MRSIVATSLLVILLAACNTNPQAQSVPQATLEQVTANDLQIVTGQSIYVPAYTEIFFQSAARTFQLTVTLAIHNTDPQNSIIIQSVRFYDTDGTQITDYVEEPLRLAPLATTGFVVESSPDNAGWGANFIVEWGAETPVYEPVVEAVMIGTQGSQGISLISPGRIISQTLPEAPTR